jgi:gamma-glutamylcyclotransferase (GGCT)/AIG2-like uncharacterized protein YtfP
MEKNILVYGTLRPELIRERYGDKIADSFVFDEQAVVLEGYKLWSYRDSYPILTETQEDTIVEFVRARVTDEETFQWVCSMEINAGYQVKTEVVEGVEYILFYQSEDRVKVNNNCYPTYENSWVKYLKAIGHLKDNKKKTISDLHEEFRRVIINPPRANLRSNEITVEEVSSIVQETFRPNSVDMSEHQIIEGLNSITYNQDNQPF